MTSSTDPLGAVTSSVFDAVGKRTEYTDAAGGTTGYVYDELGRLTSQTNPNGETTSYVYDAEGRVVSTTRPDGVVTASVYDSRGRVTSTSVDGVVVSSRTFDAAGRVASSTNALGVTTGYGYDAAGRMTSITTPDGTTTTYTYDAAGQVLSVTSPSGTVAYAYDLRGRTTSITGPDGAVTEYLYDASGRVISEVAADGTAMVFTYDTDGRLGSATDPLGNTASVTYDGNGQRVSVTDPLGRVRVWEFDAAGRLLNYSVAGASQLTQSFDLAGRLTSRAFGDGLVTTYEYDPAGRLTRIVHPVDVPTTFTYTPSGQRATVTDARGTTTSSYDTRSRLIEIAAPEGTIQYSYDDASRLTSMTTPAGITTYDRDVMGRITSVTDPEGGVYTVDRDEAGRITSVTYPNGVIETITRDDAGRPMGISITDDTGTVLAEFTAERDVAGRLTLIDETWDGGLDRDRVFDYDDAGRLTSVETSTGATTSTVDYLLDGLGNRTTTTTDGTPVSSTANDLDQLTSTGTSSYSYDLAGRLTEASDPAGTTAFSWNSDNRLTTVTLPTGGTVTYAYDVDGNVVSRTDPTGTSVDYLYDTRTGLPHPVSASDGTWWLYIDGHPLAQHADGATYYLHADIRDDIRLTTDTTGQVADTFTWTVDGVLESRIGTTPISVGYRSETVDPTTGLIWLRARWYDPVSARFLSADPWHGNPSTPISLNRYLFANADPVNLHDPTGMLVAAPVKPGSASATSFAELIVTQIVFETLVMIGFGTAGTALLLLVSIQSDQGGGVAYDTVIGVDPNNDRGIDRTPETRTDPSGGRKPPGWHNGTFYCEAFDSEGNQFRIGPAEWEHVLEVHKYNVELGDSEWRIGDPDFNDIEIAELICDSLAHEPVQSPSENILGNKAYQYHDPTRHVGLNQQQLSTSDFTVVVRPDGSIATAHPGTPSGSSWG